MRLAVRSEIWPLAGTFTISRGSRTETEVVVVELADGAHTGRGECMANPRYGETQDGIVAAIEALRADIETRTLDRTGVQAALPAGAARNALDCAYWDLDAKRAGERAWSLAGLPAPAPVDTAYTLSLDTPDAAVRENAPDARLIVDANEGWRPDMVRHYVESLGQLHVQLIEQPLPAGADDALADRPRDVPICADESCHTLADLDRLARLYDVVNIKLDKTGGLT
jgi:L-alanine-DL-glutamate epimerase-like enolase superfamily enzyme